MAFPKLGAALKRYVFEHEEIGKEKWSDIAKSAGVSEDLSREISSQVLLSTGSEASLLLKMIEETAKIAGKEVQQMQEELGEAYLFYVTKHPKWADRFQLLSPDILGFISNLDNLFHYLNMTMFEKKVDAPAFRLEDELDDKKQYTGNKEIHYYSRHEGFNKVAYGFIRATMRKHFMDSKTQMNFRSSDVETIENIQYEHAVFLLLGKGKRKKKEKPPKMVAETEKGAEGQLDKDTVSSIMNAIKTGNVTKTRKRWAMIRTAMAFGALIDKFEPLYPKRIIMNPELFCDKFPYHMAFDKTLVIKHVGVSLQRMFAPLRLGDCKLDSMMELVHPPIPFTPAMVRLFPNQLFRFRVKPAAVPMHWRKDPMLELRGQFLDVDNGKNFLFLGSPAVESLQEIRERHFFFGEIALHDKTRDLAFEKEMPVAEISAADLQIIQQLRAEIAALKLELENERNKPPKIVEKIVEVPGAPAVAAVPVVIPGSGNNSGNGDLDAELKRLKEELAASQTELKEVNDRCLQISSSMLPHYLAQQWIQNGYRLDFVVGVYEEVTVLFADVVQFSQICNQCKPDVVTSVLNDLYRALDSLTYVHDVFKVEYIGDAYVCCGGLPIPVDSHAERVCNMALGIMAASKQVLSPVTGEPIKLRIGIHTGPVITGIIGEKIPRFCVYGSTLTLASRMESHGLLGRIQISPATKHKIDGKGFRITDRGEIEVRGVGMMYAYLLEGSAKSDAEILGKVPNPNNAVQMNAGGSNFYYDKSLCMANYGDNLLEGQPIPTNPLLYKGVGKAVTRMTRQKTLAQVEMKQKVDQTPGANVYHMGHPPMGGNPYVGANPPMGNAYVGNPVVNTTTTNGYTSYETHQNAIPGGSSTSTTVTKTIIMKK